MEERMKELDTSNVEDFPVANFFKLTLFTVPAVAGEEGCLDVHESSYYFWEGGLFVSCVCVRPAQR